MLTLLFSSDYPGPGAPLWQYFGASLGHSVFALCFISKEVAVIVLQGINPLVRTLDNRQSVVFLDYLNAAMDTFDQSLAEARDSGTLEHLLVTQTSLPVILAGSAIYPFVSTTLRIAVYLTWGALLFGFPLHDANWPAVAAVLLATLLAFSGLGILSASYVLLFKRGNPGKWFLLGVSSVAGGVLFPVNVLPDWLQFVAKLNPVTYALDAMRAALLGDAGLRAVWRPLLVLFLFAALLLPLSMAVFAWALRRTKTTGTLMHR